MSSLSNAGHAVIVFARVPEAGRVKTRLAAEVGDAMALAAYTLLGELVINAAQRSRTYSVTVAYTPDDGERRMRQWLGGSIRLKPQATGDLGERMAAEITDAIRDGARRVVVIGTDCPDISALVLEDAFDRLATADVVLGPAVDGGYYLIGMSRLHAPLFERVPWSSPDTLRATLEHARVHGLSIALLDERRDIDTADDWRAWLARRPHEEPAGS